MEPFHTGHYSDRDSGEVNINLIPLNRQEPGLQCTVEGKQVNQGEQSIIEDEPCLCGTQNTTL